MAKRALFVLITALLIPSMAIYAADVTDALYSATVRAVNTSYTAQQVAVPFTLSTDALIDGYYISSSVNNVAIQDSAGNDIVFMPAPPGADDFVMFIPQISQNSSVNYKLYTGGPDMSAAIAYFPASTGMTTPDGASLEPGDDFEIIIDGYINTAAGADKYLIDKDGALSLYVSDDEELTLNAYLSPIVEETAYLLPNAAGDLSQLASSLGDNWDSVNDPVGDPDDNTSMVYNIISGTTKTDLYHLTNPAIPADATITYVGMFFRTYDGDPYKKAQVTPQLKLGGTTTEGTRIDTPVSSWGSTTEDLTSSRPGGGAWQPADFENLQAGIKIEYDTIGGRCTQLYLIVDYEYTPTLELTAADIESGEHEVKVSANGTNVNLYVDNVLKDFAPLGGFSIADNAADWEYCLNNSITYLNNLETYVSDILVQQIKWEYDTTFTDGSGSGNDATPTFRTTSTDADVSASLLDFVIIAESELDEEGDSGTAPIITAAPDEPPEAYGDMNITIPGAEVVNTLLDAGRFPHELFWYPLLFGIVAGFGMLTFHFTRSVMLQSLVTGTGIALVSLGIIGADFWVVIPYVIVTIALLTSRKTVSL